MRLRVKDGAGVVSSSDWDQGLSLEQQSDWNKGELARGGGGGAG